MAFPTQFALSLELTRLIPLGLTAASKAAEAVMSLARDLQNSGSDIVVEADLAEIFGRSRIEPQMASSFRNIIAKSATSKLCEGISLEHGPGPTTLRALAPEQAAYFATVIQCSFLTFVLQRDSLASTIKMIFDKQAEEAPPDYLLRAGPSEDGIVGFLQACEAQTSSYDWSHLLLTVATMLNYTTLNHEFEGVPAVLFRGLISTLALVQHFPEEQMIQIECGKGTCLIVVWAHHILGLSVLVHNWHNNICTEVQFGSGPPQVIIDARNVVNNMIREPSLTLLALTSEDKQEPLFTIKPGHDESEIESIYRIPAKGYGKAALLASISAFEVIGSKPDATVQDMINVTCAFAFIISKSLCATPQADGTSDRWDDRSRDEEGEEWQDESDSENLGEHCDAELQEEVSEGATPFSIDKGRLVEACKLIFDQQLNEGLIGQYVTYYTSKPLNRTLELPAAVAASFNKDKAPSTFRDVYWQKLVDAARYLAILILAFAHVRNVAACAELMLHHQYTRLIDLPLIKNIRTWDGVSSLSIDEFTWLRALSLLMISHPRVDGERVALFSDRGWSIYLSTFSLDGPSYTDAGFVVIKKGTPFRNGVYKHLIVDGLDKGRLDMSEWQLEDGAGDEITLQSKNQTALGRPFCGESRDAFVVTLRINFQDGAVTCTRRTGYRELFSALWTVQRTQSCDHPLRTHEKVTLRPGFASVSGFGDLEVSNGLSERVLICLTANNDISRWRALLAIACAKSRNTLHGYNQILLRGSDCCLTCVIDQMALQLGKGFIVL